MSEQGSMRSDDLTVSVCPGVQMLVYFPGDGPPFYLPDDSTPEMLRDWFPHEISRIVLAARLRAFADMLTNPTHPSDTDESETR